MDYERIHKVQMGVISPSKLRMKLLGSHNCKRKEEGSNSCRTSPSKLEELEHAKNHLLTTDADEEVSSYDSKILANSENSKLDPSAKDLSKEKCGTSRTKSQNISRGVHQFQPGSNLSTVHPVRSLDEDGNGYDSGHDNGSTSSFEFHRGERTLNHSAPGPFFRHVPSKWNDAEKWIVNRQAMHSNALKKTAPQTHGGRQMNSNWVRIAPESMIADTKRIDSTHPISRSATAKFSFDPHCLEPKQDLADGKSELTDVSQVACDLSSQARLEVEDHREVSVSENPTAETTVIPTVQSVSMRDIGTEMTPIPSQDPSRTGTPIGATTPTLSPMTSVPSTPKRGSPEPSPVKATAIKGTDQEKLSKAVLSERELRLKTRREIAALGVQLGKMNIASWASNNEEDAASHSPKDLDVDQHAKAEYEARAAAWEEAEKAKHMARYRREEVKIQAWETHQKAKFEAKMRKTEVQAEQIKAQAEQRMAEKLAVTRQQAEEKREEAEARKNHQAARTARQVEEIRQTGRIPPSHFRCCSWFL